MRSLVGSTVLLTLAMASTAMAGAYGTIDLGFLGRPGPHMGNGGRFDYDIVDDSGLSLPADWKLNRYDSPSSKSGGQDGQDDVYSFCIQLTQFVPGNSNAHTYDVDPIAVGGALDKLGDYYWASAITPGNNTEAGAFQLAAWEIALGNGDLDISTSPMSSGSFTNAAKTLAQTWLNSLAGLSDILTTRMVSLTNSSYQNQVTQISAVVPEAATVVIWSFVAGAIGLVLYRRSAS